VVGLAGVSIDSRSVQSGELFLAVRGPRHDGHDFVAGALAGGAAAGLVARECFQDYPEEIRLRLFAVDDTLAALHVLASRACDLWRQGRHGGQHERWIAGVAGSVGKTTTKEILAALVASRFRVLKTQGNLNNEYGLPLTLLALGEEHDAAVVELGMSHRGELARLAKIARPEIGVITRVAIEHLEFFSSIADIALAERELIEHLAGRDATAILNADDERVARFADVASGRVIRFGTSAGAEIRAEAIEERGIEGSAFDFIFPSGRARLELPLIGRHNVMNALAALAAASVWGIGATEAKEVFPKLVPADKRGEVVRYEEGFTVINDSYNSSPSALRALAGVLATTPGYRRRILASGEMLELGETAPELHRECGCEIAALRGIDWIFGVQGYSAELVRAAIEAGHPKERVQFFENSSEAAMFLSSFVGRGDLLLLKGSRGVKMERILEAIEEQHPRAGAKAPRAITKPEGKGRD
jgi:UDP-N-acetylmuramoyl-tripeptide--D-alanyl-D-alanine ligase